MLREDYGEQIIYCPLLKKEIDESYCYEINSVRRKYVKPSILGDTISREDMTKFCPTCEHCPFSE